MATAGLMVALVVGAAMRGAARAQTREDPQRGVRMGVTDEEAAAGLQPRVWVRTTSGNLRAKEENRVTGGWTALATAGTVVSGIAGVSHLDTLPRERAFYVAAGRLRMRGFDGGAVSVETALPNPSGVGTTIDGADVGAVTWNDGGTQRIAVGTSNSEGRFCIWEGTFSGGFASAPWCSAAGVTASADVAAAVVGGPALFVVSGANVLRFRRTGTNAWTSTTLAGPTGTSLRASLDVTPSTIAASGFELVVSTASTVYAGRVTLTGTTASWTTLPALPSGAQVSNTAAALALVRYRPAGASADRMAVGVQTSDDRLARLTTNAAGTAWNSAWNVGAAGALAQPLDQSWHGNGAGVALPVGAGTEPVFFGTGGVFAFFAAGYTLQAFSDAFTPPFRDYVQRPAHPRLRADRPRELEQGVRERG
jgi:hypothetical protein